MAEHLVCSDFDIFRKTTIAVLQISYLFSKIARYSVFRCIICMSLMFVAFIFVSEASCLLSFCYLCTYVYM